MGQTFEDHVWCLELGLSKHNILPLKFIDDTGQDVPNMRVGISSAKGTSEHGIGPSSFDVLG